MERGKALFVRLLQLPVQVLKQTFEVRTIEVPELFSNL